MKAVFLSDLHLGAKYIRNPREHERLVCQFMHEECADAEAVYMLGDVLDYWFEYRYVVPRGFVRFFGTLAELADKGVKITWLTGNHDIWLFGYLQSELGIEVVDAPYIKREIGGKVFILAHGDRIGRQDRSFEIASQLFRNRLCQALYKAVHPRWTVPMAQKWSNDNRCGRVLTPDDEKAIANKAVREAEKLAAENPSTDYIVMGHHHLVVDEPVSSTGTRLIVLGDWIDKFTYGIFDGEKFELKRYNLDSRLIR